MTIKRATIYIRMSTDEQESSPERQLKQIIPYCHKKGYKVVGQYEDLAMRGYDDSRPNFLRLLRDAQAGKFDVVVVDEQSRLTRNNVLDYFALVAHPLQAANVILDTVAKGTRDWSDLGDIIIQTVDQHTASAEVITLSRRVVTELARRALTGDYYPGKAPFGYKKEKTPTGNKLTPGDEHDQEIIRWVFESYVNQDMPLSAMMKELHRRGVQAPRGGVYWSRPHLRNILTNRAYVGDYVYNKVSVGRFHRISVDDGHGTAVVKKQVRGKKVNTVKNDQKDWFVITNFHQPLISRELFERAQAALQNNRERRTPTPSRGDYCLNKMLVCGKCGSWMTGDRDRRGLRFYICGGYCRYGPAHCNPHRVREDDALGVISKVAIEHFLTPTRKQQLRDAARKRQQTIDSGKDLTKMKRELAELEKKIARATSNILLLDPSLVPQAQSQVRQWEANRVLLSEQLGVASKETPVDDTEKFIGEFEKAIWNLSEAMQESSPETVRRSLRKMLVKVELHFEPEQKAKRCYYRPKGGVAYFFSGDEVVLNMLVKNPSWSFTSMVHEYPFSWKKVSKG